MTTPTRNGFARSSASRVLTVIATFVSTRKVCSSLSRSMRLPRGIISVSIGAAALACTSDDPSERPGSMGGAAGDVGWVDAGPNHGGSAGRAGADEAGATMTDAAIGADTSFGSRDGNADRAGDANPASSDALIPGDGRS